MNSDIFNWTLYPEAERFLTTEVESFLKKNTFSNNLREKMFREASIHFFDWLDHVVMPYSSSLKEKLLAFGFTLIKKTEAPAQHLVFRHERAIFPQVLLCTKTRSKNGTKRISEGIYEAALKVECITDILSVLDIASEIEGAPLTQFRSAFLNQHRGTSLKAVERKGYIDFRPQKCPADFVSKVILASELWRTRPRGRCPEKEAYRELNKIADKVIKLVGRDMAAHLFFEEERHYYYRRNRASRYQRMRQNKFGLGFAVSDHHTYRSSREYFTSLIKFMLKLGFNLRERYHAGAEAGWGAQIIEHPSIGISCFCDVDLAPEETNFDFTHKALPERETLGTVGLWCKIHGEAIFDAGIHHLAGRFDFDHIRPIFQGEGHFFMKPFSDFSFLKQAFTKGEHWRVNSRRIDLLLKDKRISAEQFERFSAEGAVGSHIEAIQRWQGFKGFNQQAVSVIIKETDPRK